MSRWNAAATTQSAGNTAKELKTIIRKGSTTVKDGRNLTYLVKRCTRSASGANRGGKYLAPAVERKSRSPITLTAYLQIQLQNLKSRLEFSVSRYIQKYLQVPASPYICGVGRAAAKEPFGTYSVVPPGTRETVPTSGPPKEAWRNCSGAVRQRNEVDMQM